MQLLASLVLLALLKARPASAAVKEYTLDVVNAPIAPDGFNRSAFGILANGTFPGPLLIANKGDTVKVTFNNKLTDQSMRMSTSIDFDGVLSNTASVYDEGSPFVTQCPFGPNTSYTYSNGEQSGSAWYHSQLGLQYADGLRGVFIIYDPDDPLKHLYDVDDESTIWSVADWWHSTSTVSLIAYNLTQMIPIQDSGLFNGVGRYVGGPAIPYAVHTVTKGTRYRFRLINISVRWQVFVSIDNHTMTVIEVDGTPTQPLETNILSIMPGARYSLVVTANQAVDNYWINAIPADPSDPSKAHQNPVFDATLSRGILRYAGAPDAEPSAPMTQGPEGADANLLQEHELRPLIPIPPPEPDYILNFTTSMPVNETVWLLNGTQYRSPKVPTLIKISNGASSAADFNKSENTFIFLRNKTVEINFSPDPANELHAFHLHGNRFWVIKSNESDIVNTVNPPIRDVAAKGNGGTILRFRTDKPGPWFFHCHIFWHFWAGLGAVMVSDPEGIRQQVKPGETWDGLCPAYDALPAIEQ
ncbi:Cu-oxidase-domain-containing protein [Roridomyces roridus]|uniref:Cu-oxidase-domain-containing protein n=1 Tax=Roridomyces roridus TaxID=1738132 RepID=A0AAD7BAS5_9AGAR|nr:Cu-oxidase-domain-containing protein [Roridomyces roridus]